MLHAAWVRENGDSFSRLSADFAAAPATAYSVNGPKLERNRAAVGADLVTHFSETAQLNVAYNAELAKSDNWHTLSATFEYRWWLIGPKTANFHAPALSLSLDALAV